MNNKCDNEDMLRRAILFREHMQQRRSIRQFSTKQVPREVIENCLLAAGSAPSGANKQPWHFVAVSDANTKRQIRVQAEKEEHTFYNGGATDEWLNDLKPLGTNDEKPFLEDASHLIVIFGQTWGARPDESKDKHYYVSQSVGIATGLLLAAVHDAGLAALTYTPAKMSFLNDLLGRGKNEKPFLVLVVGYPAEHTALPSLTKKGLEDIATFIGS